MKHVPMPVPVNLSSLSQVVDTPRKLDYLVLTCYMVQDRVHTATGGPCGHS